MPRSAPNFRIQLALLAGLALSVGLGACATDSNTEASVRPSKTVAAAPSSGSPAVLAPSKAEKPAAYALINGNKEAVPVIPMGDPATIARILDEGKNRNKVIDHLTHLCTQIGPRLTGSSAAEAANHWTAEQFRSWGYDAQVWKWGEIPVRFDRGPSSAKVGVIRENDGATEFQSQRDLEFTTLAWNAGTNGPIRGKIVRMPTTDAEFDAVKDDLAGAWVLVKASGPGGRRGVTNSMSARARAFAEIRKKWAGEAVEEAKPVPAVVIPADGITGPWEGNASGGPIEGPIPFTLEFKLADDNAATGTFGYPGYASGALKNGKFDPEKKELTFAWDGPGGERQYSFTIADNAITGSAPTRDGKQMEFRGKRPEAKATPKSEEISMEERVLAMKPAGFISPSGDERVRTSSINGWRELDPSNLPQDPEVQVRRSDYDWMNSRLADGNEIYAEFDLKHTFTPGPIPVYNTVAEIKGTTWPDEVVIVSAHIDSWNGPGSMGTTDNGTGSSVTLEAARLLAVAKAKPKRTIRFILWTGEEQGLLGSREYVKHLQETGEIDKISAVFVDDGGTNYEGGLQCTDEMAPMLAAATAPVNGQFYSETDQKFLDVNVQPGKRLGGGMSGGSSDHASFLRADVPGFFWDEVGRADYGYGWHTQNDKLDLAIPEYLTQSSTCAAITAYNLACAPTMLPRPEKPEPRPAASPSASEAKPETKPAEKPAPVSETKPADQPQPAR